MQNNYSPTLQVGTIVRGRYLIENVHRNTGFESMYLVRDKRDKQKLFVLKEAPPPDGSVHLRFFFDAMAYKELEHPALPHLYRIFNDSKFGRAFLLTEFIEGPNLEMLRSTQPGQRFSPLQVVTSLVPVVEAIAYLHNQDHPIFHGNIKPANIILNKKNGLATLVGLGLMQKPEAGKTVTVDSYHSPGFRAPEQYDGMPDGRTDIYALGAVLYTLLSGKVPAGVLYRMRYLFEKRGDPLVSVEHVTPDIPSGVANTINRAMSIDKNQRYSKIEDMWNDLWQASTINP